MDFHVDVELDIDSQAVLLLFFAGLENSQSWLDGSMNVCRAYRSGWKRLAAGFESM